MNEYEPNPKLENLVKRPPKDYSKIFIILGVVIGILIFIILIMALSGKKVTVKEVSKKQSLDEVTLELEDFIEVNGLDALDAYTLDGVTRVAIDNICEGVYNCHEISGEAVSQYIMKTFDKEVTFSNINCEVNDGVIYTYDSVNNKFVFTGEHPHERLQTSPIYTKVYSINRKDDKITLVLNKLYYDPARSDFITTDPRGINQIFNANDYMHTTDNGEDIDLTKLKAVYENNYDRYKNRGTRYKYTFVKKGIHYVLEKYEVISEEE